jgi:hypothetical protein
LLDWHSGKSPQTVTLSSPLISLLKVKKHVDPTQARMVR